MSLGCHGAIQGQAIDRERRRSDGKSHPIPIAITTEHLYSLGTHAGPYRAANGQRFARRRCIGGRARERSGKGGGQVRFGIVSRLGGRAECEQGLMGAAVRKHTCFPCASD
jgi:hypothetical protein